MTLIRATENPLDVSVGAARTCYSGKGPIFPDQVSRDEKAKALRDRIASSTLKAGHLTTRQHVHFVFVLEGVSRHAVWSFFHSHPHYNSEQVSQRYVEVKPDQFYLPPSLLEPGRENQKAIYLKTIQGAITAYGQLTGSLFEAAAPEYFKRFPGRSRNPAKWESAIKKRAMEAARYILPVSTTTYLYHTIDGLTLHRYVKMMHSGDVPGEVAPIIQAMVDEVKKLDPAFAAEFPVPAKRSEIPETKRIVLDRKGAREFNRVFDASLSGKNSVLASVPPMTDTILDDSFHGMFGIPGSATSRSESLAALFELEENPFLGSLMNEGIHSRQMSVLSHVNLTYRKKISHTADSQDQRHRVVYGSRPYPMTHYTGEPDYITPLLIETHAPSLELYKKAMVELFTGMDEFLEAGGEPELAVYLLPNGFPIRFYETGNLAALRHKWIARSCFNAQEEIFAATLDEIREAESALPYLQGLFRAPCELRYKKGISPHCPEGDRFCGVRVWELDLDGYERIL